MIYPFHIFILSENQIAEDAEQYRCRQQETGNPVDEPEESPETDKGTAAHTGDMPLVYR